MWSFVVVVVIVVAGGGGGGSGRVAGGDGGDTPVPAPTPAFLSRLLSFMSTSFNIKSHPEIYVRSDFNTGYGASTSDRVSNILAFTSWNGRADGRTI